MFIEVLHQLILIFDPLFYDNMIPWRFEIQLKRNKVIIISN